VVCDHPVQGDRFWVRIFVKYKSETLTVQQALQMEEERHEISEDDWNRYSDAATTRLQNVPSLFVWNADETGVGISKKHVAPDVLVAKQAPQELSQSLKNGMIVI
jgi:hypothetical protein